MHKHILYILPKSYFFKYGWRGRVTHAIGVITGIGDNTTNITVVSGSDISNYTNSRSAIANLIEIKKRNNGIIGNSEILWQIILFKRVRKLITQTKYNAVIIRYSVGNIILNLSFQRLFKNRVRSVVEINSLAYHQLGYLPGSIRKLIIRLEILLLKSFNSFYVVSDQIRKDLIKFGCNNRIHVVPNGSDVQYPLNLIPDVGDITRLVYFGKFQPYYDFISLISDFISLSKKIDNIELHFWGNDKALDLSKINVSELKNIHFHGSYLKDEMQNNLLSATDILILPFKPSAMASIGSPTKLYEYMSYGLPIIAAKIGQVGEVLSQGYTGYYYNPEQSGSLQKTLYYLLNNKKERIEVGANCKNEFLQQHTWKMRMKSLLNAIGSTNVY